MSGAIVAGNWKMYGSKQFVIDYVQKLARARDSLPDGRFSEWTSLILFPPVAYLGFLGEQLARNGLAEVVEIGGQDLHEAVEGAFTGSISGEMLRDLGARWVLVGHSERRQAGESNERVAAKLAAALRSGLKPVLCIGETEAQRDAGAAGAVVAEQIRSATIEIGAAGLAGTAIAYEPVWAIGTGKTATADMAQTMHELIRRELDRVDGSLGKKVSLLYGGSVKAANAAELFLQPDIDGGLVGGASLDVDQFVSIALSQVG